MSKFMEGVVTIVQESRFQLTDDDGVGHLFILSYLCGTEPRQLPALQANQSRVRVSYSAGRNMIGNVAHSLALPV